MFYSRRFPPKIFRVQPNLIEFKDNFQYDYSIIFYSSKFQVFFVANTHLEIINYMF